MSGNWTQQWTATAGQANPTPPPPPRPVPEPARRDRRLYAVGTFLYAVLAFLLTLAAVIGMLEQNGVRASDRGAPAVLAGLGAVTLVVILRHLWSRRTRPGG